MIVGDVTYHGHVREGSRFFESTNKGTPGFQVMLTCPDGDTDFIIWLTKKNKDRALQYFDALGVNEEQLRDRYFLEHQLADHIVGREIAFGTKTETWQDKPQIKVAWIGKRRSESVSAIADEAAAFFGAPKPEEEDGDIPFGWLIAVPLLGFLLA